MSNLGIYIIAFVGVGNTYVTHLPNLKISRYEQRKTNWQKESVFKGDMNHKIRCTIQQTARGIWRGSLKLPLYIQQHGMTRGNLSAKLLLFLIQFFFILFSFGFYKPITKICFPILSQVENSSTDIFNCKYVCRLLRGSSHNIQTIASAHV